MTIPAQPVEISARYLKEHNNPESTYMKDYAWGGGGGREKSVIHKHKHKWIDSQQS